MVADAVVVAVDCAKEDEEKPEIAKSVTNKRVFILWVLRVEKLKSYLKYCNLKSKTSIVVREKNEVKFLLLG